MVERRRWGYNPSNNELFLLYDVLPVNISLPPSSSQFPRTSSIKRIASHLLFVRVQPFVFPIRSFRSSSATPEWRNSRISIAAADKSHSGTYSCSLLNTTLAEVNVQVLNGEWPKIGDVSPRRAIHCRLTQFFFSPFSSFSSLQPIQHRGLSSALLPGETPAAVHHNAGGRPPTLTEFGQSPMPIILVLLFYRRFLLSAHIC